MFERTRSATRIYSAALSNDQTAAPRARSRRIAVATAMAFAGSCFVASSAMAENCAFPTAGVGNLPAAGVSAAAVSSMIGSTLAAANTAFLLQSTAFIGSPPNPTSGQQGGGVWIRGVDGNVNIKSNSTATATGSGSAFPGGPTTISIACSQQSNVNFGGFQIGSDISKLNYNGWNLHSGVTAGDLGAKSVLVGGFPTIPNLTVGFPQVGGGEFVGETHVPFIGIYGAATNGGFAVDALLRTEFYQGTLDAPVANVLNQNIDAHGWTFATSASYQWPVPDTNWFLEPSAGLIISRTTVDQFTFLTAGAGSSSSYPGTLNFNRVESDIGRLGLRFGETVEAGGVYWQPFGAVSVWHEFGKDIVANFTSAPGFQTTGLAPPALNGPTSVSAGASTSNFGTYGQYSVGLSAAIPGTGWLEFLRADYRSGPDLQGWSGSGGIRYQFTPGPANDPPVAKARPAPVRTAVNWTGFYVGAVGGATQGTADWGYGIGEVSPHIAGYLFGAEVGYNYQFSDPFLFGAPLVVGAEIDWTRSLTTGGTSCGAPSSAGLVLGPMYEMTCNARFDWMATAAARAGLAFDRALFYAKLGAAWTEEKFQATCNYGVFNLAAGAFHCTNPAGAFSNGLSATKDRVGWLVGWGSEYSLTDHWSAKGEADYIGFGDQNLVATDATVGNPPSTIKVGMHVWQEKIGVNYRF